MIRFDFPVCIGRRGTSEPVTVIKCNDPGVTLGVQLMLERKVNPWRKRLEPYSIPEGATAMLRVTRPDRAYTVTGATIEPDGVVVCPVHPYSVATPGRCTADVSLYDLKGKRLTSASFVFDVDRECAPVDGQDDPIFVDSIQNLIKRAEDAAERAEQAGSYVNPDMVQDAVDDYMKRNPVTSGATKEQADQIDANKKAIEELPKGLPLTDAATGKNYKVYVTNGKLTMSESEV